MNKFRPHITVGHTCWKRLVKPGDTVIDATCGNGHDTLCLAQLALTSDAGHVFAIDIQPEAIKATQKRLQSHLPEQVYNRVNFLCQGHEQLSMVPQKSVKLIVYNLGYLPGGDRSKTTKTETTLESISQALGLITSDGFISIACYPGHEEGKKESAAILNYLNSMISSCVLCAHIRYMNCQQAPHLYFVR